MNKNNLPNNIKIVTGDIIKQEVEVIVNAWNRNIIPFWMLIPQGVSKAIKKEAGYSPFIELSKMGSIPLGEARITSSGKLPFKNIIHVAGINMFWFATEYSIRESVKNAMKIVNEYKFESVAFPLIGSGSGNRKKDFAKQIILDTLENIQSDAEIVIVEYKK